MLDDRGRVLHHERAVFVLEHGDQQRVHGFVGGVLLLRWCVGVDFWLGVFLRWEVDEKAEHDDDDDDGEE